MGLPWKYDVPVWNVTDLGHMLRNRNGGLLIVDSGLHIVY